MVEEKEAMVEDEAAEDVETEEAMLVQAARRGIPAYPLDR